MDKFMQAMTRDPRLGAWHLCLFTAIAHLGKDSGYWIPVTRKTLMQYAGIRSAVTYHKYLQELVQYGYIHYQPNHDPLLGSQIAII